MKNSSPILALAVALVAARLLTAPPQVLDAYDAVRVVLGISGLVVAFGFWRTRSGTHRWYTVWACLLLLVSAARQAWSGSPIWEIVLVVAWQGALLFIIGGAARYQTLKLRRIESWPRNGARSGEHAGGRA